MNEADAKAFIGKYVKVRWHDRPLLVMEAEGIVDDVSELQGSVKIHLDWGYHVFFIEGDEDIQITEVTGATT